jgi:hypothetical protein
VPRGITRVKASSMLENTAVAGNIANASLNNITAIPTSVDVGDMVLLQTQTASSSSTIDFTSNIDSTYDVYCFKFIDLHPTTDNAQFLFQTSTDGGSNYNTTITSTFFYAYHFENDSATALAYDTNMDQAQGTSFQRIIDAIGNLDDESASGTLVLYNPSSTTFVKHYMSECNSYVDGTYTTNYFGAGYFNTTSAINAVQFKPSAGTLDGVIKLYGIK